MPRKKSVHRRPTERPAAQPRAASDSEPEVRIIGGTFRGRRLRYHGDPVVRPMKHRTREAIFNLITTDAVGRHAIDLFAGTGALGIEALSRGAASGTFIEKHVPTARVTEENIRTLGVDDRATLLVTSAFLWGKRDLPNVGRTIVSVGPESQAKPTADQTDKIVHPTTMHYFGILPSTSSRSHWSMRGQSIAQVPKSAMWR